MTTANRIDAAAPPELPSLPLVLVVDDDPDILGSLERALTLSGFRVLTAPTGRRALELAAGHPELAVMVLDWNMPDGSIDGLGVITALRAGGSDLPICVLSARRAVGDRIRGLEEGADDYVTKPFDLGELIARLRALIRRGRDHHARADDAAAELSCGRLRINVDGRQVFVDNTEVALTRREFELLEVLLENQGIVLSRATLLDRVWGYDFPVETNVVDVFVGYLRRKLVDAGPLIHTVRAVGYVLRPEQTGAGG